jgi:hypothetical protein
MSYNNSIFEYIEPHKIEAGFYDACKKNIIESVLISLKCNPELDIFKGLKIAFKNNSRDVASYFLNCEKFYIKDFRYFLKSDILDINTLYLLFDYNEYIEEKIINNTDEILNLIKTNDIYSIINAVLDHNFIARQSKDFSETKKDFLESFENCHITRKNIYLKIGVCFTTNCKSEILDFLNKKINNNSKYTKKEITEKKIKELFPNFLN